MVMDVNTMGTPETRLSDIFGSVVSWSKFHVPKGGYQDFS